MSQWDSLSEFVRTEAERRGKDAPLTRRQWLTTLMLMDGTPIWLAIEAVATTAIEHPEWDMEEERTWREWEEAA